MKTMRIRNLLTLAVCCLAAVLLSGAALAADADIVDSGTCGAEGDGSNLKWTLDSEGTLTISGQGKMPDSYYYSLPWYSKMDSIKTVCIDSGVTSIGSYAFISCAGLTSVTIPSSVTSIGEFAFGRCTGLTSITIPDSVTNIGICAFYGCTGLTSITIPDSVASISEDMFNGCTGLTSVTIPDSVADIGENAFSGCSNIETVYYTGSQSKWQSITIGSGNDALTGADIRYNCAYGGTEEYRLEGITVTAAGETVQELCAGELLVSIAVRHMQGDSGAVVMLAQYDAEGRYQGLLWLTLDEMPLDMALKVTLPVDNSDGKIANLKALVVSSILSPIPMGNAVSFGSV